MGLHRWQAVRVSEGGPLAEVDVLDSLQRRMRAMHSLYYDAVATMDLDQVNHFERDGVVPSPSACSTSST